MAITECRVCGYGFFDEPLLQYANMPKSAQFLPVAASLKNDEGVDLNVYQCAACGLVQLNSHPVHYYRDVIRAAAFSEEMRKFRLDQFAGFIKQHNLVQKKVIEIGCGRGEYLSLIRDCHVDAYGIENSAASVAYCIKHKLNVFQDFIESNEQKVAHAPFDAFLMLSFLEHLPQPNAILQGICRNLADDAVGIVEVPNFDMIIKKKLFSEFISDHLFYFTRDTLIAILQLNGFDVLECKNVWYDYILSAVVKKRTRMSLSVFYKSQEQLQQRVSDYLDGFGDQKVAIWGAGHQALAMMSLMRLEDRIKYVVDSAPFKQGKYTPATHIPIVSPEMLNVDPVDAVIVMAASYSNEVVQTLRKNFNKNLNVVVLKEHDLVTA
ncbi:MAG: methyltransferase domain-containing protein [Pseudomonadota bacterium]